jgi:type III secretion protein V
MSEEAVLINQNIFVRISAILAKYKDLLLPFGLLLALATFFAPIPGEAISVLIVLNLAVSIIVLVTSLNINTPVQLSSYPTILLLTTIFRLTISVSAARNILLYGDAGTVISSLGAITAGKIVLVGAVMFAMILVVQYVVVARGAERISEVAARFTLDAMPGRQMTIDADLRSGLLTAEEARAQRIELQREAQLYGAMDGAMKFVRNDAAATVIIALINISAGLLVGLSRGLNPAQAAQKYAILAFGDGLAAVISSLLITISAGIVVTRVASADEGKSDIGTDIAEQIFTKPVPFFLVAGIFGLLTPLNLLFGAAALLFSAAGFLLRRKQKQIAEEQAAAALVKQESKELQPASTMPLAIAASRELNFLFDRATPEGKRFHAEVMKLRTAIYYDLGVMLPNCHFAADAPLKSFQYVIALREVPVAKGFVPPNSIFVNETHEKLSEFELNGEQGTNPADLSHGTWISVERREIAERANLKIWEAGEFILLHLSAVMRKYAHEFVGIQETRGFLDFAARSAPALIEEIVPKRISLRILTDVLQRLVREGISIRDLKTILEALSETETNANAAELTEKVRRSLSRYISFRYAAGGDTLFVYLLETEVEDIIRASVRRTATSAFLSLDPATAQEIVSAIRRAANHSNTPVTPVVLTAGDLRRFVREIIELEFPHLPVLAFQEITPEMNIQTVSRVSMRLRLENGKTPPLGEREKTSLLKS